MGHENTASVTNVKQRNVGDSGLRVSSLGLRTEGWTEAGRKVLESFVDEGGSLLDVSPSPAVARAVSHVGARNLVTMLDLGVSMDRPVGQRVNCSRRSLLNQLDDSLRVLGLDSVDIITVGHFDPYTPAEEVAEALELAVYSGRAHYSGAREYAGWQLAVTPGLTCSVSEYSLLRRRADEEIFPAARYLGLGTIAHSVLASGLLASSAVTPVTPEAHPYDTPAARTIADAVHTAAHGLELPPAAIALSWVLSRVDAALVSVGSLTHLEELLAARDIPVAIDRALEEVSRVG